MKKYLFIFLLAVTVLASCNEGGSTIVHVDPAVQARADEAKIKAFVKATHLNAVKDTATGLYYVVTAPGKGAYPKVSSSIDVNYSGRLLNGTIFDAGTLHSQPLAGLIDAWKIAIPHVSKGGKMIIISPSALAYGEQGTDRFPANSVMVFTIELLDFK